MNITEKIRFYANIFQEAFKLTANEEASVMITQEIGKDLRQSLIPDKEQNHKSNKDEPATIKQVLALRKHNLYKEGMTKEQATNVIKASIEKSKPKEEEQVYY